MSDMSRPGPRPSAAEHEQHDALLVSQFAAGDALDATAQLEAELLVSTCPACASLVADLRAVSRAVAQEPVASRRRDFRLDADRAERLRGNAATRFLRRLSLPSTRGLQPAAAGVLSIGLAFVVAGYVWPDDGSMGTGADMNVAPAATGVAPAATGVAPAAAEERLPSTSAPIDGLLPAQPPAAEAVEEPGVSARQASPQDALNDEQTRSLPGEGNAAKAADRGEDQAFELESAAGAIEETSSVGAAQEEGFEAGLAEAGLADAATSDSLEFEAIEADRLDPDAAFAEDSAVVAEDAAITEGEPGALANDTDIDGTASTEPSAQELLAAPSDDGLSPESLLLVVGVALALAGGLLLLLVWLARHQRDPLLR